MLQVNFQISDDVVDTIKQASRATDIAAVIAVMEKEAVKQLGDAIPASGSLDKDLTKVRAVLAASQLQAAYVVVYGGSGDPVTVVTYTSDSAKPKERMLYSSGAAHLREVVNRNNTTRRTPVFTAQTSTIDEIEPSLFQRTESAAGRAALMTESERHRDEIAKMAVAPRPTAMPGVQAPLSQEAVKLLAAFAEAVGKPGGMSITFCIEDNQIVVDKHEIVPATATKETQLAMTQAMLPASEPRYVLTDYPAGPGKPCVPVMVYVCPGSCPPRVKMPYASCKASFLSQLSSHHVHVEHRSETSSADEFADAVEQLFATVNYDEKDAEGREGSGKPRGARGPAC